MYSLNQLKRAADNPKLVLREFNRLYHTVLGSQDGNTDGIDLFEADWDNLIILDACRYDMFAEANSLPGELESRRSKGSHTTEFLRANFAGRELHDTVYVTASPMYYRDKENLNTSLHAVINVWKEGGWHDEYRTVPPETVTKAATQAAEEYPHKRLLVHFLQPHYPFIGPTGREHFDLDDLDFEWDIALSGELDISDRVLWEAFEENLELVLPHVETLMNELPGKTVVTADHGQMINERSFPIPMKEYGHPPGLYTEELVKVPWLQYNNGDRRNILAEQSNSSETTVEESDVQNRLEDLGYIE